MAYRTTTAMLACMIASPALAQVVIDFDTEDDGLTPLVNGQHIEANGANTEFGRLFDLTIPSDSDHAGGVVFNTNNPGPNAGGQDPDLLVNLGNALTFQENHLTAQSVPGVFNTPNDAVGTGSFIFDFLVPDVQLLSITLIDMDRGASMELILTDRDGFQRTYSVPSNWTHDRTRAGIGYADLDLTSVFAQDAEGSGGAATVLEQRGFNPYDIARLRINQTGSGAIDNLTFTPTPGSMALVVPGLLLVSRRRR